MTLEKGISTMMAKCPFHFPASNLEALAPPFGIVCFRQVRRSNVCRKLQTEHHNAHWWHSMRL
jgi:hypothetical protein